MHSGTKQCDRRITKEIIDWVLDHVLQASDRRPDFKRSRWGCRKSAQDALRIYVQKSHGSEEAMTYR